MTGSRDRGVVRHFLQRLCFSAITAIGCIAPKDKMEGRAGAILAEREIKLAEARQVRKNRHQYKAFTAGKEYAKLLLSWAFGSRESPMAVRLPSNSR
jgi:hypothetical protein